MENQNLINAKGFFPKGMTTAHKILMGAVLFFGLLFLYMLVSLLLTNAVKLPSIPGGLYFKVLFLSTMTLLYFSYMRGWKTGISLLLFLAIYCWAVEDLSIHTGFPFGHYYYSDMLGFKIDVTPGLLGFNYFWMLVIPAYFIANLITDGTPFSSAKTIKGLLFTAFITAIIVAGIDMVVDPLNATRLHEWVWTKNSYTGYYGIPYVNFLGYIIVMTPAYYILKMMEKNYDSKPIGPLSKSIVAIPLIIYFVSFVLYAAPGLAGVFLVGLFTMIFPLILAVNKLLRYSNINTINNSKG